jgi:hypothetical protein
MHSFFVFLKVNAINDFLEQPFTFILLGLSNAFFFFMCGLPSRVYLSAVKEPGVWNENLTPPLVLGIVMTIVFALVSLIFVSLYFKKTARRIKLYRRLGAHRLYLLTAIGLELLNLILISIGFGTLFDYLLYGFVNDFQPYLADPPEPLLSYMNGKIFLVTLFFFLPTPILTAAISGIHFYFSYDVRRHHRFVFGGFANGQN